MIVPRRSRGPQAKAPQEPSDQDYQIADPGAIKYRRAASSPSGRNRGGIGGPGKGRGTSLWWRCGGGGRGGGEMTGRGSPLLALLMLLALAPPGRAPGRVRRGHKPN